MLDRLKSFFGALTETPRKDVLGVDDPRVAAAALMVHIIEADGVRDEAERKRLRDLLADAYDLSGDTLDEVVSAGEKAEREAVDLFAFTSVLNRSLDETRKVDLIALLWEIVYADGEMHELEDNIVWRVSELIGVSPRDRMLMRQRVRDERGLTGTEAGD